MTTPALKQLIAQLGGTPSLERQAILQETLDAICDRLDSLERRQASLKLKTHPWKSFGGTKGKWTYDKEGDVISSNATLNESRQPGRRISKKGDLEKFARAFSPVDKRRKPVK